MNARVVVTLLALAAAPAAAQDGARPPVKPADPPQPAAPAPAEKKERKTSSEAEAAIGKYVALLHFPSAKYKSFEMNSHCDMQMLGGEVGCKFKLSETGEIALDIALQEAVRQQYGDEQLAGIRKTASSWVGGYFKPFLVPADVMAKQYDLASRVEGGKSVLELTRFAETAAWDKATLTFNADGLLEKQVGTPNVDPDDPIAAMNAGAEIEMTIDYKKRGDLWTIESARIVEPLGESTVAIAYYELAGCSPLPKELSVTTPLMTETLVIALHDFVINGTPVAETARKAESKEETPPAKKDEPAKKEDAVKPAEPKK